MIPNKKTLSRTIKKHESVAEKMVSRSGNRKHTYIFFWPNSGAEHRTHAKLVQRYS